MDFASSTSAVGNKTRWKGIVVKSPVVPQRPGKTRIGVRDKDVACQGEGGVHDKVCRGIRRGFLEILKERVKN